MVEDRTESQHRDQRWVRISLYFPEMADLNTFVLERGREREVLNRVCSSTSIKVGKGIVGSCCGRLCVEERSEVELDDTFNIRALCQS